MAARVHQFVSRSPHPLDHIKPQPLSIRTLDSHRSQEEVRNRIRGEFVEMRGFSPTLEQAARLFDLSREECGGILAAMVREGALKRDPDGRYRLP
jgi:hypothetical protein